MRDKPPHTKKTEIMNAFTLLNGMTNCTTYVTVRGTTGDADGTRIVDSSMIEEYEYADVVKLAELKEINEEAYGDILDYVTAYCKGTTEEDYYVIIGEDEFILAW